MKAILFYIFSAVILIGALLTVTSARLLRSAVFLLSVLIATAGVYFLMDYTFLAAVQLTLYAGGIIVLIIFSVMLTSSVGEKMQNAALWKRAGALALAGFGAAMTLLTLVNYQFQPRLTPVESGMHAIGTSLVSTGDNGYALPFEVISILLLAAMVAAIIIARRDGEDNHV